MRWLSSGWVQACDSTLTTGRKRLSSAVSQSHVNTVHTSYSQHRRRIKKNSHFKHSPVSEELKQPPPSPPQKPQTDTLYHQRDYLHYSQMIQDSSFTECKKMCFSLLRHSTGWHSTEENERSHSVRMLRSPFKILQYGSRLAMTDKTRYDRKRQKNLDIQSYLAALQCIWRFAYKLLIDHCYYISAILD